MKLNLFHFVLQISACFLFLSETVALTAARDAHLPCCV